MYLKSQTIPEALEELASSLEREIAEYKSKIDETIPKPLKYRELPNPNKYVILGYDYNAITLASGQSNMFVKNSYYSSERQIDNLAALEERKGKIFEVLEKFKNDCEKIINENKEIKLHNDKIVQKIELIMRELGIRGTYSTWEYKTGRSSKRTEKIQSAGYLEDLDRLLGYPPSPSINIEDFKKNIEARYREILSKIQEEEKKIVKEKEKAEKAHSFALLRAKYTPDDALSDYEKIRDVILSKDKYLRLAYWLEKNRGDWSDGYHYAERGIGNFTIETTEDAEIDKSIRELIQSGQEDGDIDGRVFRDCEYNYCYLYSKVNESIIQDFNKLKEFEEE